MCIAVKRIFFIKTCSYQYSFILFCSILILNICNVCRCCCVCVVDVKCLLGLNVCHMFICNLSLFAKCLCSVVPVCLIVSVHCTVCRTYLYVYVCRVCIYICISVCCVCVQLCMLVFVSVCQERLCSVV